MTIKASRKIKHVQSSCCALLILCLCSCGFHLRGTHPSQSSVSDINLEFKGQDVHFKHDLTQALASQRIQLKDDAPWTLQLSDTHFTKRRSTSSVTAQRDRFTVSFNATFTLIRRHDDHDDSFGPLVNTQYANFQDNETLVVSKHNEELQIQEELRQKAAYSIIQQTRNIINHPPTCQAHHENQARTTR